MIHIDISSVSPMTGALRLSGGDRKDMATYQVDKAHTEVGFTVRHMVFTKVHGQFEDWEVKLAYDEAAPTRSTLQVEVATASVNTREEKRDGHLRSADFFDAEKFPKMVFQ